MAAAIGFYVNRVNDTSTGLGFFSSSGFGSPVAIGSYNGRTFISDSSGITEGAEASNNKYINQTGIVLGQSGSGILLTQVPNSLATLNIRATFDSPVRTLNHKMWIYDGVASSITGATAGMATGLFCQTYEVSHLSDVQTAIGSGGPSANIISGQHAWTTWTGAAVCSGISLTASPGISGLRPSGSSTVDSRHDTYLAISVSPTQAGSKSWALYTSVDYL